MNWMKHFFVWSLCLVGGLILLTGCEKNPLAGKSCSLSVKSTLPGAEVYLDGVLQGEAPLVIEKLVPGNYSVEVRKEGYDSIYKGVYLIEGEQDELVVEMEPIKGLLLATSSPEGAEVLIDGVSKGETPLLLPDLPLGRYRLDFQIKDKFLPRTKEVELVGREPVEVHVALDSRMAQLTADSEPEGAEVRINGVVKGTTPTIVQDVVPGLAKVQIEKRGYVPFVTQITFAETTAYELSPVLDALPAGLTVLSSPSGVSIYIDNVEVGFSPITLSDLEGGVHEVTARLEGYAEQTKVINLEPDATESIQFDMVKNSGILMLITEPANADVYVDGVKYATSAPKQGTEMLSAPLRVLLQSGINHKIQIYKDGYVSSSFELQTKVDQVVNRHEILKRIFVYDTEIVTHDEIIKCRMEYELPNGDIYYERFPGVFDTADGADIVEVRAISLDDASNADARRALNANERPEE